ncbi:LamG domain-containing protein [Microbacteriaceae bacterium]|nr:LamG domain-containing protein [Candidatus Saccharibacteria bacterium]
MKASVRGGMMVMIAGIISVAFASQAMSARFSSTSYIIDASVMNNFGGQGSSTSFKVTGSGGESIIGNGAGGSYKIGAGYVAQLEKGMQLSVQPSGLLGHYPLDETVLPSVYDNSANIIDGTAVASPASVAGKLGTALSFNGTTQYVGLGSASSFSGSAFTIESWIKSGTNTGSMAVITKASNFWLGLDFGKAAIYDWTGATTCSASTAPSLGDNTWHHIAATLTSGTVNGSIIYIDGVQQKTCTWTPAAQTGSVGIGATKAVSWQQFFNGSIDNVKIFNRVFSTNEIKAEYDAQNAGNPSGIHLGTTIAGTSSTSSYDAIVRTDAGGYTLGVNQNQNLTNGAYTIPAVSGSIASPVTWSEGTTKGLGFTLFGTNATAIPGKWSSGNAYAAFPASATTFYSRTGYSGGAKDYLNMRVRLDVGSSQATGEYQNTITTTGTMIP